jgi:alpha-glucosidase
MSIKPRNKIDSGVWWKHGVVYQIYPRSFYDSNGDGVGDLRGIIEKTDYLHWLGIDAVWLSPVQKSPMFDFGYDISDYRRIDPIFGTLDHFDELIRVLHDKHIRLIMDLVVNHTSHLHPWFLKSRFSRNSTNRNWYIWQDGGKGKPPNNWVSVFGGSAWKWDEISSQYYLHSFLEEQPDLNWRCPELRIAVYDDMRFWLDRGVDGFRIDVINWLVKDTHLRDNPALPFFPYIQRHVFDRNRPETHEVAREMRALVDRYGDRMLVGEVFSLPPGNPFLSAEYLANGDDELHLAFDFSIIYRMWSARRFYRCVRRWMKIIPDRGWPCHVLSNHDQRRGMSRYGNEADSENRAKVAAILLLTAKGTPFIYYGEEIGMRSVSVSRPQIRDPLGKRFWPFYRGRDPSRSPMQWSPGEYAGFSKMETWLPVHTDFRKTNVEFQKNDRHSMLRLYRAVIEIRRRKSALRKGDWIPVIKGRGGIIAYYRIHDNETIFIVLNFTDHEKKIHIGNRGQWQVLVSTHRTSREHFSHLSIILYPYEATIIEKIGEL